MNDDFDEANTPADEIDDGQPILELAALREPVDPGFTELLRRRIERRMLARDAASASWYLSVMVLLELLMMVAEMLGLSKRRQGDIP